VEGQNRSKQNAFTGDKGPIALTAGEANTNTFALIRNRNRSVSSVVNHTVVRITAKGVNVQTPCVVGYARNGVSVLMGNSNASALNAAIRST
jgi:hypothetical protein